MQHLPEFFDLGQHKVGSVWAEFKINWWWISHFLPSCMLSNHQKWINSSFNHFNWRWNHCIVALFLSFTVRWTFEKNWRVPCLKLLKQFLAPFVTSVGRDERQQKVVLVGLFFWPWKQKVIISVGRRLEEEDFYDLVMIEPSIVLTEPYADWDLLTTIWRV